MVTDHNGLQLLKVINEYINAYGLDNNGQADCIKVDRTIQGEVNKLRMYTGLSSHLIINGPDNVTSRREASIAYSYDDYNNRETMTVGDLVTSYAYDKNSRLTAKTKVDGDVTCISQYGYDPNGNQIYRAADESIGIMLN